MESYHNISINSSSSKVPHFLPFTQWMQLNSVLCITASICALITGVVLFIQYFCTSYSHVLRSAFNDVFVAVVMVQVIQALQLLIVSIITLYEGHSSTQHGMTFAMCNISASLYQFFDAAQQLLQIAFFVVLANSRRLTSLEVVDDSEERVDGRWREDERPYSSGRSSACYTTHPRSPSVSRVSFSNKCIQKSCLCAFLSSPKASPAPLGVRHTLVRITWKVYFAALFYASVLLVICWVVLFFVPGLSIVNDETSDRLSGTLYYSYEFAWCWIPGTADIPQPASKINTVTIIMLQLVAAYISPLVFAVSAVLAYCSLRRSSPSLLRDHAIVPLRIVLFCVYPMFVYVLGAVYHFIIVDNAYTHGPRRGLAVAISFLYPFTAVVNVFLFLYTEELLGGFFLWRRCWRHCRGRSAALPAGNSLECGSDISRSGLSTELYDDGVIATTGFCGVVKAIACSTVAGLPPSMAQHLFDPLLPPRCSGHEPVTIDENNTSQQFINRSIITGPVEEAKVEETLAALTALGFKVTDRHPVTSAGCPMNDRVILSYDAKA